MTDMTVLGFDFGMKRIGVAIGHTVTQAARPLSVLAARDGVPSWPAIDALIKHWRPGQLVLGVPWDKTGGKQTITYAAMKFGQRLASRYQLPVAYEDERFSSCEARCRPQGRITTDSVAAQVIVEAFLQGTSFFSDNSAD